MTVGLRTAALPDGLLRADMLAVPFGTEHAFRMATTALHPLLGWGPSARAANPTVELWSMAEQDLRARYPAHSLDELAAVRDMTWFPLLPPAGATEVGAPLNRVVSAGKPAVALGSQPVPLANTLRAAATTYLVHSGDRAALNPCGWSACRRPVADVGTPTGDAVRGRRDWRWLTTAMPPDLLVAALPGPPIWTLHVDTVTTDLAAALRQTGFAETHLHLGAAWSFTELWSNAMAIAATELTPDAFVAADAPLWQGAELSAWILRAAIARWFLAHFLRYRLDSPRQPPIPEQDRTPFDEHLRSLLQKLVANSPAVAWHLAAKAIRDLLRGSLCGCPTAQPTSQRFAAAHPPTPHLGPGDHFAALQALYLVLCRRLHTDPLDTFAAGTLRSQPDPSVSAYAHSGEAWLIWHALRYLKAEPKDHLFATIFWQVTRVRCITYRHTVQRPMTPGLNHFTRSYHHPHGIRGSRDIRVGTISAAHLSGKDRGLRSLEVRTTPPPSRSGLAKLSDLLHRASSDLADSQPNHQVAARPTVEVGTVLHFTKQRYASHLASLERPTAYELGSHADPGPSRRSGTPAANSYGYRYSNFYRARRREALALASFLKFDPGCLRWIRAIDVCTDERAVPTWVLAPLFRYVRGAGDRAAAWLSAHGRQPLTERSRPQALDLRLRVTAHAGEDFVHLMSGLRRVDEALRLLCVRTGDRLGHAVALGTDPESWAQHTGLTRLPAEERLLDLLWEWERTVAGEIVGLPSDRFPFLKNEITRLGAVIFEGIPNIKTLRLTVSGLSDAFRLLTTDAGLLALGFPGNVPPVTPTHDRNDSPTGISHQLAQHYLRDAGTFVRSRMLVEVDPTASGEIQTMAALQRDLVRRVSTAGVAVEVNPSSNLFIGNLGDLEHHPVWRLAPPDASPGDCHVDVVIGSDDPDVFATTLPDDLQRMADVLIAAGRGSANATAWVERRCKASLAYRFTLPELGAAFWPRRKPGVTDPMPEGPLPP
ncbi:MAG: hypothetical protein M0013_12320 [Actinomycetota bacterium]|nr:hypothetical protein [Actinomycetota bacterium]